MEYIKIFNPMRSDAMDVGHWVCRLQVISAEA